MRSSGQNEGKECSQVIGLRTVSRCFLVVIFLLIVFISAMEFVTRQVVTNFINCFNVRGLRSYIVVLEQ